MYSVILAYSCCVVYALECFKYACVEVLVDGFSFYYGSICYFLKFDNEKFLVVNSLSLYFGYM
jgi:hypothetical protein